MFNSVPVTLASGRNALWIICNHCQKHYMVPSGERQTSVASIVEASHTLHCRKRLRAILAECKNKSA